MWSDDVVDCAGTGTGGWQKIDNSSVLSGIGTGQTVALWEGAGSVTDSETLGNSIMTQSGSRITTTGSTTATAEVRGVSFYDGYITWTAAQINRYGAAIELQYTPTNASTFVKIGANGSNPTIFNAYTGDAQFAGNVTLTDGTLTVGTDGAGRDVLFRGGTSGAYFMYDASEDGVVIVAPTDEVALGIRVVGGAQATVPQFQVGRGTSQYLGMKVDDRISSIIHRQDETDAGVMQMNQEIWDSGTGIHLWNWKSYDGAGASGTTRMTLNKTGELNVTTSVTAPTFLGDLGATSTINTGVTGTTQAAGNNSTKIATTAYADAAAGAVPIGNYLPLAGGTLTGALAGTGASFTGLVTTKIYKVTSVSISNSYVRVAEIDETGYQLSSSVRVTMTAHGTGHVVTCNAIISVGHSQDILIESNNLAYTQVTLKVDSDSNGKWTLSVKSTSANAATYQFDIQGLSNNLTITLLPTTSQTGTTLEHTTNFGTNITSTGGAMYNKFGGKLFLSSVDANTTSVTALVLDGDEVEKRTLGTGAFGPTPVGAYLPLASMVNFLVGFPDNPV